MDSAAGATMSRGGRWWQRALLGALLIAFINGVVAFNWAVPRVISPETASSWAVDTIAPLSPLTEAYYGFTRAGTDHLVYPLFHYMVLAVAYVPPLAFAFLTGSLRDPSADFPYGATDPEALFGNLTLVAHAVSLLMALGIVALVFAITRRVFTLRAAAWAACFAATLAPLGYYAKTSNLDVPYLFWTLLAVWQYLEIVATQRLKHYALLGAFMALAVATKDQAYGFFVLLPVMLAAALARERHGTLGLASVGRALVSRPLWVAGGVAALVFALGNNLLFGGWGGFVGHVAFLREVMEYWLSIDPERRSVSAQLANVGESVVLYVQMLGYITFALCAVGVVVAARERRWLALSLLLLPLGYYVAVLGVAGMVLSRYVLGPALLLLPFAGAALDRALAARTPVRVAGAAVGVAGLCWQIFLCVNLNVGLVRDSRYALEAWIRANVPPGATIEAQIQQRYLPRVGDTFDLRVVGNALNVITYDVTAAELTPAALASRNPEFVLVLAGVGLTGDPETAPAGPVRDYFAGLLAEQYGYRIVASFATPSALSYRQVTSGTHPRSILLARGATPALQ